MTSTPELAAIDWASLEHAYGPALDTPRHLEQLAAGDPKARKVALKKLAETIHHQTETYSATAAAVPALVAMATDPNYPDRLAILEFIAGLAVGDIEPATLRGFDVRTRSGRGTLEARDGGIATYEAVSAAIPKLAELLSDPSPPIRAAAAFLVSLFADRADSLLRVLRVAIAKETEVTARASMLLSLRSLATAAGDRTDLESLDERVGRGDPKDLDTHAAAIARLAIGGRNETAVTTLSKQKATKKSPGFLWGDLRRMAQWVLDGLELDAPTDVLIELESGSTTVERKRRIAIHLLPKLLVEHKKSYLTPEELGSEARRILTATAAANAIATTELDLFFDRHGVPPAREHHAWLGLERPGLAERVIARGDRSWPVWKWLHAAAKAEIEEQACVDAIAGGLSTRERIELSYPSGGNQITQRYNLVCYYDADGPDDDFGIKRREERIDGIVGLLLGTCELEQLIEVGERIAAGPKGVSVRPLVVAVGHLARARGVPFPATVLPLWERWIGLCALHRDAFASLAIELREKIIWAEGFDSHEMIAPSPNGPVTDVVFLKGWTVADLCPVESVARAIVGEISSWTGPQPALQKLIEIGVQMGAPIRPAVQAALATKKKTGQHAALEELLSRLDAARPN